MTGRVLLGAVLGPHGIKGEVRVKTFTLNPENLGVYGTLVTASGRHLAVAHLRVTKPGEAIVGFEGVHDRNAAEALDGEELFIARDALPDPDEGEFYQADLIGLRVEDREGEPLGKVRALHNFGAGDILEVELIDGGSEFLPFADDTVLKVDIGGGRVVVELPRPADE